MDTASKVTAPWEADAKTEKLMRAAYRALYPVAKLFLKFIHGAVLGDLFQRILVDIAHEEILNGRAPAQRHKKVSLTELNLKTGLDTRRIRKYMEQPLVVTEHNICAEAAILARWAKDPMLRKAEQPDEPQDLIAYGRDGTFEGIVKNIAGRGVSATPVLERMVKRGNVEWISKYHVRLVDPTWKFIEEGEDEVLESAANSIAFFCGTLDHNLINRHEPAKRRMERQLYSYLIPADKREDLEHELRDHLNSVRSDFIQVIGNYESKSVEDESEAIGIGFFMFRHPMEQVLESTEVVENDGGGKHR